MRVSKEQLQLYAVTDSRWLDGKTIDQAVLEALQGGATMVQLRDKGQDPSILLAEARLLVGVCHNWGVPLIVDDDAEIALAAKADGVHVGQSDLSVREAREILGPEKIIGATAHNVEEAVKAQRDGADYLGCGAAFGSSTKKDAKPIDRNTYKLITSSVSIPVCAIGGINAENIHELFGAGLAGVAVVSGIFAAPDIRRAAHKLKDLSKSL